MGQIAKVARENRAIISDFENMEMLGLRPQSVSPLP